MKRITAEELQSKIEHNPVVIVQVTRPDCTVCRDQAEAILRLNPPCPVITIRSDRDLQAMKWLESKHNVKPIIPAVTFFVSGKPHLVADKDLYGTDPATGKTRAVTTVYGRRNNIESAIINLMADAQTIKGLKKSPKS